MHPAAEATFGRVAGRTAPLADERSLVVVDEVVMERFRLLERIGSGGMGTVYRAFDQRLQRHVAVKDIDAADPDRVLREAQAAARLNHPGIVTLYELGQRGDRALLVSELVPGSTLAALRSSGELSDREVAEIGVDLCEAIAHAHAHGVVHRDVKPQNVIVRDHGGPHRAKLMDFGIARIAGAPTVTATGEVVGTLAYMSPEQAEGLEADTESDVYSLALTLYECWAGSNPVAGHNPAETARRIGDGVPSLRSHRPDLPEGLTDIIDACLDPDPDLRPDALELRECLEAERDELDDERALAPLDPDATAASPRPLLSPPRIGFLVAAVALLGLMAGPLGAPGLALVLFALALPLLALGLTAQTAPVPFAPVLAAIGLGGATPALGAFGSGAAARAVLGASAWAWTFAAAVGTGAWTEAGIADRAPSGWENDPAVAAESVLGALVAPEALLAAMAFALAAVALGWVLSARHAPIALLGAMLWAAAVAGILGSLGDGGLAGQRAVLVLAAGGAVAVEFGLLRDPRRPPARLSQARSGTERTAAVQ
jgi:eukaryotic-like serine/threonine-protein kinase